MIRRTETRPKANLLPLLAALVLLCLGVAAVLTVLSRSSAPVAAPVEQLSLVVQRMPFEAQNALRGESSAFDALGKTSARLKALRAEVPSAGDAAAWGKLGDAAAAVTEARAAVEAIQASNQEVRELAPKLLSELGDLGSSVGVQKLEGMSRYLERFELTVQRIQQDLNGLGSGVSDAGPSSQRLADSLEFLNQVIRGLSGEESGIAIQKVTGADPEQRLKTVMQRNQQYTNSVRKAIGAADALAKAQTAARAMPGLASTLTAQLGSAAPRAESVGSLKGWILGMLGLAALLFGALAWTYSKTANVRRTNELRVRENERNQEAIMRLLDELSSLADGDLTVQATVTEDITGAIADSINYAIEALRELVTTINDSAIQLDGAAKQTQGAAAHMAKASSAQSRQISAASESMADMAASIEEVSGNSERCSDVARHSVDVAHKGGDAVRRTIDGMNAIRETIQETSKRIKRLGESSQEIGNTVELINDIAEQTNILALERIDSSVHGGGGRPRFCGRCRRSAEIGRTRSQCDQANRSSGAHHPNGYQRGRRIHGAQHHGRRRRRTAGGKRRRRARGDRAGLQSDRKPGAEHFRECAPASCRFRQYFKEHASGARDFIADGGRLDGNLHLDRQTRGAVGSAAQIGDRVPASRLR